MSMVEEVRELTDTAINVGRRNAFLRVQRAVLAWAVNHRDELPQTAWDELIAAMEAEEPK